MIFTSEDRTYSGTDIISNLFKIIHHELEMNYRFYNLRGSFATIASVLGHKRIETK